MYVLVIRCMKSVTILHIRMLGTWKLPTIESESNGPSFLSGISYH